MRKREYKEHGESRDSRWLNKELAISKKIKAEKPNKKIGLLR